MRKLDKSPERLAMEIKHKHQYDAENHLRKFGMTHAEAAISVAQFVGAQSREVNGSVTEISASIRNALDFTPNGFIKTWWGEVVAGDEVYARGTQLGQPRAYGPFEVIDPERRTLKNLSGTTFLSYTEDLLRRL